MTYRVVQWATGAVGSWSLRQILDHPDLELVGLWVSNPDKDGKDAGDLVGRPSTGIRATTSKADILDLDADVVLHTSVAVNTAGHLPFDDDVEALLRSGKNVISTASYFSTIMDGPEVTARMQAACAAGGATLYGSGIDPGFVCDRLVATLSGSVGQVDRIRMIESQDVSTHPGYELLSEVGFGKRPDQLSMDAPGVQYYAMRLLPAAVAKLSQQLGVTIEGIQPTRIEHVLAEQDTEVRMGTVAAGTIIAVLHEFSAMVGGAPFISHQWVTYMDRAACPADWYLGPDPGPGEPLPYVVRIEIDGKPSLTNDLIYRDSEDETSFSLPTAAVAVNAIPDVVAAPPGLLQEEIFGRWRASA